MNVRERIAALVEQVEVGNIKEIETVLESSDRDLLEKYFHKQLANETMIEMNQALKK